MTPAQQAKLIWAAQEAEGILHHYLTYGQPGDEAPHIRETVAALRAAMRPEAGAETL